MTTLSDERPGWAVWLTGLPASGKSSVAAALADQLRGRGEVVEVLESDQVRRRLTPSPTYDERERDLFYAALAWAGTLLTRHGVGVIFDATANRRRYRDAARADIPRFLEVWVRCPLEVCRRRDRKGIYAAAEAGRAPQAPGAAVAYEPNEAAEIVVAADREPSEEAAARIVAELERRRWIGNCSRAAESAASMLGGGGEA